MAAALIRILQTVLACGAATAGGDQPRQIRVEMRACQTEGLLFDLKLNEDCLGQNQSLRQIKKIKYLHIYSWNNRRLRGLAVNQSLELVAL